MYTSCDFHVLRFIWSETILIHNWLLWWYQISPRLFTIPPFGSTLRNSLRYIQYHLRSQILTYTYSYIYVRTILTNCNSVTPLHLRNLHVCKEGECVYMHKPQQCIYIMDCSTWDQMCKKGLLQMCKYVYKPHTSTILLDDCLAFLASGREPTVLSSEEVASFEWGLVQFFSESCGRMVISRSKKRYLP